MSGALNDRQLGTRIRVSRPAGDERVSIEFTSLRLRDSADDGRFRLDPPPDAEIVDY